jgi:3-deoxy-D-manno-octulosonate 8-phosphate phosphatase (KDO 8-P phosphatase)
MILPKLILTDIDGVWTDGGMYYDQTGNEWKKFNTADSAGVLLCKTLNIKVGIITRERTEIVKRRSDKLKLDYFVDGCLDKVEAASIIIKELNIGFSDVAFIGDDLGDIKLLKLIGISGTPSNGIDYIKSFANIITKKSGGEGAFREFVETIVMKKYSYNEMIEMIS